MIFCFTGTGNSLHVADRIAEQIHDRIVMMTEAELQQKKEYRIGDHERIGFVFPIYWWGMPKEVERFINNCKITVEKPTYVYAVCTYGLAGKNGMDDLKSALSNHGLQLDLTCEVKMVDNYVVGYALADAGKQMKILLEAETEIEKILQKIADNKKEYIVDRKRIIKPAVHSFYKRKDHRHSFRVDDTCIGCGKCERECPSSAIRIIDQQPVWVSDCSFCLKCIHSCPKEAIQYGKTAGRKRYHYGLKENITAPEHAEK